MKSDRNKTEIETGCGASKIFGNAPYGTKRAQIVIPANVQPSILEKIFVSTIVLK